MTTLAEVLTWCESATPENPAKLRVEDGAGQHLDILVTDATVNIKMREDVIMDGDEEIQVSLKAEYAGPEDDPYWDDFDDFDDDDFDDDDFDDDDFDDFDDDFDDDLEGDWGDDWEDDE